MKRFIIILAALLLLSGRVFAQAGGISAEVDRTALTTDEFVTLTISVNGSGQPVLPPLEEFNIVGTSSGTSISIINGVTSSQATYRYRLQPIQAGALTIGAIGLSDGSAETAPITLTVEQGSGTITTAPRAVIPAETPTELTGQDYFIEAEIDNLSPYQGEQVTYTLRFYQAVNARPQVGLPTFAGFWNEYQPEQTQYMTDVAERRYLVTEWHQPLFPTVVGGVSIDPAQVEVGGGLFSRAVRLQTQPVELTVQPLPAGAPADFNGAVGQFTLTGSADSAATVNEPLTWQVVLAGTGNIDTLGDPAWPTNAAWRVFDTQAQVNTQIDNGVVRGQRVYDRVLVPTTGGDLTLPALTYSYFDPETAQYETLATGSLAVQVDGAVTVAPTTVDNIVAEPVLRPLKNVVIPTSSPTALFTAQLSYWLLWLLPLLALTAQWGWQARRRYLVKHADKIRQQTAAKRAHAALTQARDSADATNILTQYLSDKLNQPVQGWSEERLLATLAQLGLPTAAQNAMRDCLHALAGSRYAPAHERANYDAQTVRQTEQVVSLLDTAWS